MRGPSHPLYFIVNRPLFLMDNFNFAQSRVHQHTTRLHVTGQPRMTSWVNAFHVIILYRHHIGIYEPFIWQWSFRSKQSNASP